MVYLLVADNFASWETRLDSPIFSLEGNRKCKPTYDQSNPLKPTGPSLAPKLIFKLIFLYYITLKAFIN